MSKVAVHEARIGLHCLHLEAPAAVVSDVTRRVERAFFALSWERMVLIATAYEWRADGLRRRDAAQSFCLIEAAVGAFSKQARPGESK